MPTTDDNPYPTDLLSLDGSNVEGNFTTQVSDGTKYKFTGTLQWATDTPIPNTNVILVVDEFELV
jgi:hypothetical protein